MDGIRFDFDLRQLETVARAFKAAPAIAQRELAAAALEASLLIERESRDNVPTFSGGLRDSIHAEPPRILADRVVGVVGSALPYALPVELGTRPHRPPIQPLADWAKLKLGLKDDEALGAAFAIAKKIEREGTEGTFYASRALAENRDQVGGIFAAAIERLAGELVTIGTA